MAPCVKSAQYAVRGEIYLAATERIKAGKEVIFTNVGNPHGLGQQPLTYIRQVCFIGIVIPKWKLTHCRAVGYRGALRSMDVCES